MYTKENSEKKYIIECEDKGGIRKKIGEILNLNESIINCECIDEYFKEYYTTSNVLDDNFPNTGHIRVSFNR